MRAGRRRWTVRHPAAVARVVTLGLGASGFFALMALFARNAHENGNSPAPSPAQRIEVRIDDEVNTAELHAALEEWLAGDPDVEREGGLRVVHAPADTETVPS
jgi:hypothetical protein